MNKKSYRKTLVIGYNDNHEGNQTQENTKMHMRVTSAQSSKGDTNDHADSKKKERMSRQQQQDACIYGARIKPMKTITIVYDDSKAVPTLNLTTNGFTNAEVLVILDESKQKVKDAVIEELKKKGTGIITPHLMHPLSKA